MLRITDTAGTSGSVVVADHDVAEAITPWYPEAPAEVYDVIAKLQDAINRHGDVGGWATYLGVEIERI
jgi:hypothetical protein